MWPFWTKLFVSGRKSKGRDPDSLRSRMGVWHCTPRAWPVSFLLSKLWIGIRRLLHTAISVFAALRPWLENPLALESAMIRRRLWPKAYRSCTISDLLEGGATEGGATIGCMPNAYYNKWVFGRDFYFILQLVHITSIDPELVASSGKIFILSYNRCISPQLI